MAELRVAIASLGTIGMEVARRLDSGSVPGLVVSAVTARDLEAARERVANLGSPPKVVPLETIAADADIVVECAPAAVFETIARTSLEAGCSFVPLSVGALLRHMDLVDLARARARQIIVPTGALLGLDAVRAMRESEISSSKIVTRKPPRSLDGAPYLVANGIDVTAATEAVRVFEGTARDAAAGFPANVNVAAALALAGVGPDQTMIEIWADPEVDRNMHTIEVRSSAADVTMSIRNVPTEENPATGRLTALSVIATLRRQLEPLVVGS